MRAGALALVARGQAGAGGDRLRHVLDADDGRDVALLDERRIGSEDGFTDHALAIVRQHAVQKQHRRSMGDQLDDGRDRSSSRVQRTSRRRSPARILGGARRRRRPDRPLAPARR